MNNNCLKGVRCPSCGNTEDFNITISATANVTDEGSDAGGAHEWDEESFCVCGSCGNGGIVKDFQFSHTNAVVIVLDGGKLQAVHTNTGHDVDITVIDLADFRAIGQEKEAQHNIDAVRQSVVNETWELTDLTNENVGLKVLMEACSETIETLEEDDWRAFNKNPEDVSENVFVPIDFDADPVKNQKPDPNNLP